MVRYLGYVKVRVQTVWKLVIGEAASRHFAPSTFISRRFVHKASLTITITPTLTRTLPQTLRLTPNPNTNTNPNPDPRYLTLTWVKRLGSLAAEPIGQGGQLPAHFLLQMGKP